MNVIGESVKVVSSRDPSMLKVAGKVLLETANTLVIESGGRNIRAAKAGSAFLLGSGAVVTGDDIAGRLQDRLGKKSP